MLYKALRPALFRADPERAHEAAVSALAALDALPGGKSLLSLACGPAPRLETSVLGLAFRNPLGLAAGFDKDCRLAAVMPALGFGFVELGSVTLRPQPGNPKPRIFRVPEAEALINRLGFNSAGAAAAAARLKALRARPVPLGINLGLNADCPPDRAPEDYAAALRLLAPYGDYFAINVSSPNTAGLRALREAPRLERILDAVAGENAARKPVLVKLDCDLEEARLPEILDVIQRRASGVIAANTTVSRPGLAGEWASVRGGLSGRPLREPATRLIARIHGLTRGRLPIIGVGGVFSGADAFAKLRAGASLIQIYTVLVYSGPGAAARIVRELHELLRRFGYPSAAAAVGTAASELTA